MRFLSPLLLTVFSCFALIGARTNWFADGFGIREINMLEQDYNQFRFWIESEAGVHDSLYARSEFKFMCFVAEKAGELPVLEEGGRIERASLSPQAEALVQRFQELIKDGELDLLPITGSLGFVRQVGRIELQLDDLTAERMEHFLTWTQKLQRGVSPLGKRVGFELGILALERCQDDPEITPWKQPLPPPR
jgi:hypothetical protein